MDISIHTRLDDIELAVAVEVGEHRRGEERRSTSSICCTGRPPSVEGVVQTPAFLKPPTPSGTSLGRVASPNENWKPGSMLPSSRIAYKEPSMVETTISTLPSPSMSPMAGVAMISCQASAEPASSSEAPGWLV